MNQVFIQMSGAPGSGKTTIANAISERIKAVIIDHDVTKSALLNAGVPVATSGRASYSVLIALGEDLLRQGHPASTVHRPKDRAGRFQERRFSGTGSGI